MRGDKIGSEDKEAVVLFFSDVVRIPFKLLVFIEAFAPCVYSFEKNISPIEKTKAGLSLITNLLKKLRILGKHTITQAFHSDFMRLFVMQVDFTALSSSMDAQKVTT
jgi:hypothetical protein